MNYKKIIKSDILDTISKIADENRYEIFGMVGRRLIWKVNATN